MVRFGTYTFPHVLALEITNAHEETERVVPNRNVAYRMDKANLGQTVKVTGEIRASTIDSAYGQIEQIRELNDGTARVFDLEDGVTPSFKAKLVDPEYALDVEDHWFQGKYHLPYSLTFVEVA